MRHDDYMQPVIMQYLQSFLFSFLPFRIKRYLTYRSMQPLNLRERKIFLLFGSMIVKRISADKITIFSPHYKI